MRPTTRDVSRDVLRMRRILPMGSSSAACDSHWHPLYATPLVGAPAQNSQRPSPGRADLPSRHPPCSLHRSRGLDRDVDRTHSCKRPSQPLQWCTQPKPFDQSPHPNPYGRRVADDSEAGAWAATVGVGAGGREAAGRRVELGANAAASAVAAATAERLAATAWRVAMAEADARVARAAMGAGGQEGEEHWAVLVANVAVLAVWVALVEESVEAVRLVARVAKVGTRVMSCWCCWYSCTLEATRTATRTAVRVLVVGRVDTCCC